MGIEIKNKRIKGYKIINILFVIKFIEQFYDDREEIEKIYGMQRILKE